MPASSPRTARGKTHSSGKLLFSARVIPYRGSWLDFEFDAKDCVYARIDRRRKLPITTLLYALGLDSGESLHTFYKTVTYKLTKQGWKTPFDPQRFKGIKPSVHLIDAKTGSVVVEAGKKITPRLARKIAEACGQTHATIRLGSSFFTEFLRLAEKTIYVTDGGSDVSSTHDMYYNKLAREIVSAASPTGAELDVSNQYYQRIGA